MKAKTKTQSFIITVPKLDSTARLRYYIVDAVESWSGQFDPMDPLFGTLRSKVKVHPIKRTAGDGNPHPTNDDKGNK